MKTLVIVVLCVLVAEAIKFIPNHPLIAYEGRVDRSNEYAYKYDWSGVSVKAKFTNATSLRIIIDQGNNHCNVILNGQIFEDQFAFDNLKPYNVYDLVIAKRTEAFVGIITFQGLTLNDGAQLVAIAQSGRRIEFIGDSITCGYGDVGKYPCSFSPETEDNYVSYGPRIARSFGAELHLEAWSGKGLVRNYGDPNITSKMPMPVYLPWTLATDFVSQWNFTSWIPDGIVINLGTNDFSTMPHPPQDIFQPAYVSLIASLRSRYGRSDLPIFAVCGPLIGDPCCQYVENVSKMESNVHFVNLQNILSFPQDYGCDGHPNYIGHEIMATKTIPYIESVLGWKTQ
eukprot:TRINITY_DN2472_c0_g4_i1.p1 TRINITY_DN2472_c0_g4~~TRINITY_DN2472_c0_g4_i1.p1  ORF type:complete len:353 (-),score=58.12 TRINITY_DN2472_c0_g4_i1:151-1176(-)